MWKYLFWKCLAILTLILGLFLFQIQKELQDVERIRQGSQNENLFSKEDEIKISSEEILAMYDLNHLRPIYSRFPTELNPCLWGGVSCKHGHIQLISWWASNLTGNIPKSIGQLVGLESLGFAFNHLKGSIPETISNLENLHTLHLGGNNLSGILSPSLGFLKSMAYLGLENNKLEGSIPSAFGNLKKLKYLGLNGNILSGQVPTLSNSISSCFLENNKNLCWNSSVSNPRNCRQTIFLFFFELSSPIPDCLTN